MSKDKLKFGCHFTVVSPILGEVEIKADSQEALDKVVLKVMGGVIQIDDKRHKAKILQVEELDIDNISWSW